jgi:hypothetical protein
MNYYTYAYLREDGTPYYIGKGKGNRIHSKSNRVFNPPPKERRIFLKQNLTENQAFSHEIYMIDVFGRKDLGTGILHNKSDGGIGGGAMKGKSQSEETKIKIGNANRGRIHSKKSRENMSKSHLGKPNPKSGSSRKGKSFSEEHIKNKSEAAKLWWKKRREIQSNGN